MNRRSRSTLFLMEQLIVVATFAVCAAACVKIMTVSYFIASETRDISYAIKAAESTAECYKAVSGDFGITARIMGGRAVDINGTNAMITYYDEKWNVCGEGDAAYVLRLLSVDRATGPKSLLSSELSIERLSGEEIIAFPVAAREGR